MIIVSCDEKIKFHFFIVRDASPSFVLLITLKMIILQRRREFWMKVLRLRILSRTNRENVFWNGDFRLHILFMIMLPYLLYPMIYVAFFVALKIFKKGVEV